MPNMEIDLLRGMIKERDAKIQEIEKREINQRRKRKQLLRNLESVKEIHAQTLLENQKEIESIQAKLNISQRDLQAMEREMRATGAIHVYTSLLKSSDRTNIGTGYVIRFQAQLCKAMHTMGMLENQVLVTSTYSNEQIKSLQGEIHGMTEERAKIEREILSQLVEKDRAKSTKNEKLREDLAKSQESMLKLQTLLNEKNKLGDKKSEEEEDNDDVESQDSFVKNNTEEDEHDSEMQAEISILRQQLDTLMQEKIAVEGDLRAKVSETEKEVKKLEMERAKKEMMAQTLKSDMAFAPLVEQMEQEGEASSSGDGTADAATAFASGFGQMNITVVKATGDASTGAETKKPVPQSVASSNPTSAFKA
eukprot:CAMPEP_0198298430 /NCGR_PEP_ID=MMETSP1449-20131203/40877_1 /TAXON_ID=420275 /ORGANISM="Attheya septentrionalis, Strain CCMP2084" /LENGTH=364 /DNA_ID=CAMNT_0043999689 /DNA_START=282 /DNA_END=1373 /DNA_ORIENTATION=-